MYVEGRIEYRQWQDKENQTRYTTEINVRELLMLSGRQGGAGEEGEGGAPEPPARAPPRPPRPGRPRRPGTSTISRAPWRRRTTTCPSEAGG